MKFITLAQFLHLFETDNPHLKTFANFLKLAKVRSGKNLIPLLEYIQDKNIQTTDLKALYDNIVHKNEYLTRFYNTSLDVGELPLHITEKPMKIDAISNNETIKYKNVIRNMFYKEILQMTQSGMDNNPTFLNVLADLYLHNIIDYKILTPSGMFYTKEGRLGSVFSSYYFRASIMNPMIPYSLNHKVLKGSKIFTPTLGWGSYCYGFMECPYVSEYVGTDVIPQVCRKTAQFAKDYYPTKKCTIFCEPSENLMKIPGFSNKYKNYFDAVFFSPPYYELELYPGKNQSTTQYKTYEEWLDKYWVKTIQLCHHVLKPGGKMCYILSGYGSHNTKGAYDLLKDMNTISQNIFRGSTMRKIPMYNKNVHVTSHRETAEKIMIFVK
jgi:hypothetical protein